MGSPSGRKGGRRWQQQSGDSVAFSTPPPLPLLLPQTSFLTFSLFFLFFFFFFFSIFTKKNANPKKYKMIIYFIK